jgi:hypothetical protein
MLYLAAAAATRIPIASTCSLESGGKFCPLVVPLLVRPVRELSHQRDCCSFADLTTPARYFRVWTLSSCLRAAPDTLARS